MWVFGIVLWILCCYLQIRWGGDIMMVCLYLQVWRMVVVVMVIIVLLVFIFVLMMFVGVLWFSSSLQIVCMVWCWVLNGLCSSWLMMVFWVGGQILLLMGGFCVWIWVSKLVLNLVMKLFSVNVVLFFFLVGLEGFVKVFGRVVVVLLVVV